MSARPFYPHEADDPDLDWLVSNFLYERPNYIPVEAGSLPIMLMPYHEFEADVRKPSRKREEKPTPRIVDEPVLDEE